MKRFVYFLIIAGTCVYFGHWYWKTHRPQVEAIIQPVITAVTSKFPSTPVPGQAPGGEMPGGVGPATPSVRRVAPPGVFYMLERVKKTTDTGVIAIVPGEEVRLMQRMSDGRLRVTTGRHDFEVKAAQVTQDYDLAQAARLHPANPATLPR